MRSVPRVATVAMLIALAATALVAPASATTSHPAKIVAVGDKLHGKTYAQWSAAWWQWVIGQSATASAFQSGNVTCGGQGQPNKHVVFLTGPFNASGEVTRTCTDPLAKDTYVLIPVLNVECSSVEADPFLGATPGDRKTCATKFSISDLSATIDGQAVTGLDRFIVSSPDFGFTAVDNNAAGIPVWQGRSTSNGAWLLVRLHSPGVHRLTFSGTFPDFPFTASASYTLTVARS
jgi:hypothetical protein